MWPAAPICHVGETMIPDFELKWHNVSENDSHRHCNYCGSLHPADLLQAVAQGARISGADWKYGWPHKFYVEGGGVRFGKWYNVHLKELSPEMFEKVSNMLERKTGIKFEMRDGKLFYQAPYHGYQAY